MEPFIRKFDLVERTLKFASEVRDFLKAVPNSEANIIYRRQLLRSSSSIGANYIEANDALGDGDFLMKIRTSRREANETSYWLQLLDTGPTAILSQRRGALLDESKQLTRIFSSIAQKNGK